MDNTGERSAFGVPGVDLTAVNFTAQDALWDSLQSAIDGISIGNIARRQLLAQDETVVAGNPASTLAQREIKWLAKWTDNVTGEIHQTEIACADLTLLPSGSDLLRFLIAFGMTLRARLLRHFFPRNDSRGCLFFLAIPCSLLHVIHSQNSDSLNNSDTGKEKSG